MLPLAVAALGFVIVVALLRLLVARSVVSVPPNALVVLTGRKRAIVDPQTSETTVVGYRIVHGGSAFQIPFLERADVLDLTEHSLEVDLHDIADADGALHALTIHANAHVGADDPFMQPAIERLLGMPSSEVKQIISSTIESRIRSQFAALRLVEGVDWDELSDEFAASAGDDLARIGIELDSLALVPEPSALRHASTAPNGVDPPTR